jgi:phospho-N-acetylmuramoyl-pentapeptide-transferase
MSLNYSLFLFVSILIQHSIIKLFQKKKWYQPIYHLSPKKHQEKPPTPTLGGLGIVVAIIGGVLCFRLFSKEVFWLVGVMLSFSSIGFVDDVISLKSGINKGLNAKQKLILQIIVAFMSVFVFHKFIIPLSFFDFLLYGIAFIAGTNATNLTDGVDGLLSTTFLISLWGFYSYFNMVGFPSHYSEFMIIICLACIGFLWFNWTPASIFMGDTGSLALGAILVGMAIISGNIWILIPLGFVYIIETLSVIFQVVWFKKTGKRLFLMSPVHHHFELLEWSSKQVVGLAMSIQFISCAIFWLLGSIK